MILPNKIADATFRVDVTQYLRPYGRTRSATTELPIATEMLYRDMLAAGCRFESEVLMSGLISTTISNCEADVDCEVNLNGPEVQAGMVLMLERQAWK